MWTHTQKYTQQTPQWKEWTEEEETYETVEFERTSHKTPQGRGNYNKATKYTWESHLAQKKPENNRATNRRNLKNPPYGTPTIHQKI